MDRPATTPVPPVIGLDDRRSFEQLVREHDVGLRSQVRLNRVQQRRAQRLGAMIDAGRCQDAYRAAVRERDEVMAGKIADLCRRES